MIKVGQVLTNGDRSVRDLVGELDFSFHVISRLSEKEVEKRIA